MNDETQAVTAISSEQIDQCIALLAQLNSDTDQIFDIPKAQRTALIKAAGQFSRPDRGLLVFSLVSGATAGRDERAASSTGRAADS